jgi:adenine phosphoribosyltransferase
MRRQCVLIVITGGSASAAGSLVKKLGGTVMGYVFILELDFLKGRDKLDAPVYTLLASQDEKLKQ